MWALADSARWVILGLRIDAVDQDSYVCTSSFCTRFSGNHEFGTNIWNESKHDIGVAGTSIASLQLPFHDYASLNL